jgi:hypothetical protein
VHHVFVNCRVFTPRPISKTLLCSYYSFLAAKGARTKSPLYPTDKSCGFYGATYKLPIAFDDSVKVYIRVSRLGSKSFDFNYLITRQQGEADIEIAALSSSVMVAYDYEQEKTIAIPEQWRENILAYEPAL